MAAALVSARHLSAPRLSAPRLSAPRLSAPRLSAPHLSAELAQGGPAPAARCRPRSAARVGAVPRAGLDVTVSAAPTAHLGVVPRSSGVGRATPAAHLTARGRVVVLLVLAVLALGVGMALGRASAATPGPTPPSAPAVAVVQPGETLWSVAQRVSPDSDSRRVVHQLQQINHLEGAVVRPGQSLVLPG